MIRRRTFIAGLGSAAAWPLVARAQQGERMRRIGVLMNFSEGDPEGLARVKVLRETLAMLGWTVGRNLAIEYRWSMGDFDPMRAAAADLVRAAPDVILATGGPVLGLLQKATSTIPIVFIIVSEPVALGFVASLARPGGNITGFTNLEPTIGAKWLELLKEIAPHVRRFAVMFNPDTSTIGGQFTQSAASAAQKFAVQVIDAPVRQPADIEATLALLVREQHGGLMLPPDGFTQTYRQQVLDLAARYQLPAIYPYRLFANDGGLMSYGVDTHHQYREAAGYVDRILRGEKPADIPVQQPVKFELVINMKTAKSLGLAVPLTLQVAADVLIE
jgi:putative ABC transport system substrate-binding protein